MLLKSRLNNKRIFFVTVVNYFKYQILVLFLLIIATGCGVYSFQQGSIPPEVQTISIANIYNESGGGPSNLGQIFTEKLKSY